MIKKPKGKYETIKYVRLYLDDIENIIIFLKENCEKIVVSGDGFELEDPLQLNEYKELTQDQLNSLHIHTVLPDDFGTTNLNLKLALPCYYVYNN